MVESTYSPIRFGAFLDFHMEISIPIIDLRPLEFIQSSGDISIKEISCRKSSIMHKVRALLYTLNIM